MFLKIFGSVVQNFKSNGPIPRNHLDRQMAGLKDGQTLFHRILPATTKGLSSTTAVDWHLKIKDRVQYWLNQKLLHHSQHAKNQLKSYTHSKDTAGLRIS